MRLLSLSLLSCVSLLGAGCFAEAPELKDDDSDVVESSSGQAMGDGGSTPTTAGATGPFGGTRGASTDPDTATTVSGEGSTAGDTGGPSETTDTDEATGDATRDTTGDATTVEAESTSEGDGLCNGFECPLGCNAVTIDAGSYAICGVGLANYTTWSAARDGCEELGGNLVRIETAAENGLLKEALGDYLDPVETAWTGANDLAGEGLWVWHPDLPPETFCEGVGPGLEPIAPQEVLDWAFAEPDGEYFGVAADCGVIYASGWLDLPCSNEMPFVCEFE